MPRFKPSIRDEMSSLAQWSEQARCRSFHDPALWDTVTHNDATIITEEVKYAREICLRCPVMMDCRIHGIVFGKENQIFGGLTDEERSAWAVREGLLTEEEVAA